MQWKIAKLVKNKSHFISSKNETKSYEIEEIKERNSFSEIGDIELRLKNLEKFREAENLENFLKIGKIEKILEGIQKERSNSPKKKAEVKKSPNGKNKEVKLSRSKNSISRNRSQVLKPKTQKLCYYIKDLEDEVEKWKKKAMFLSKKCMVDIKDIKKELNDLKTNIIKEKQEIIDCCSLIINRRK